MATQLSKAEKIRKLLHLSNAEIAKQIGCEEFYVRAVRQRTGKDGRPTETKANTAWRDANWDRILESKRKSHAKRYASDPAYRKYARERNSRWKADNRDRVNATRREWYHKRRAEARVS